MKSIVAALIVLVIAASTAGAQVSAGGDLEKVYGARNARWVNGEIVPGGPPDRGSSIWDNTGLSAWWSGCETAYINLDWGLLPPPASGLADHVIDGFTFSYGTNSLDHAGESIAVYFFDSCTGWGNLGVEESAFLFTNLPNCSNFSSYLPPGYGWIWTITIAIEGTGYEFLLGQEFGFGVARAAMPSSGRTGIAIGTYHPSNGTQNAFDIYYPNRTYNGTWWFGTSYWATWPTELFGTEGEANMTFYGVGAQGNDAGLYAAGEISAGSTVQFLLRENELGMEGYLAASLSEASIYIGGGYDVTRLVGGCHNSFPKKMKRPPVGDFHRLQGTVPLYAAGATIYFQGLLSDIPLTQPPIDASNGLRVN